LGIVVFGLRRSCRLEDGQTIRCRGFLQESAVQAILSNAPPAAMALLAFGADTRVRWWAAAVPR
jgi:hypothetical protein